MKKVIEVSNTYYTPEEVARLLKVSKQTVYNWINEGRLKAVKAGRTTRIAREAISEFLEPAEGGEAGR
jgi:putative molybdopterin biosynthesis protein